MSQGLKQQEQAREPAKRARKKVQMGLFVCIRAEILVSTALPTSLCCLRLKWESISPLQFIQHLPCILILCFSFFLQIQQFVDVQGREHSLPATCEGPLCHLCHENLEMKGQQGDMVVLTLAV